MLPQNTTHDWALAVDHAHLAAIRAQPDRYAPGGVPHLVCEVLAYAADEAAVLGGGRCEITCGDGWFRVADRGRGTATVRDPDGRVLRKPVMSTRDLRFFDAEPPVLLPDGHPRRGMSVVAASSPRLEHTNRRTEGSWTQVYRYGVPAQELVELPPADRTGTTVTVWVDRVPRAEELRPFLDAWPSLRVGLG